MPDGARGSNSQNDNQLRSLAWMSEVAVSGPPEFAEDGTAPSTVRPLYPGQWPSPPMTPATRSAGQGVD